MLHYALQFDRYDMCTWLMEIGAKTCPGGCMKCTLKMKLYHRKMKAKAAAAAAEVATDTSAAASIDSIAEWEAELQSMDKKSGKGKKSKHHRGKK